MRDVLLGVKGLNISFTTNNISFNVVNNLSLSVSKGKTLALVGESGCGKTLTALSILQLLPDTAKLHADEIRLLDQDLLHATPDQIRSVRGSSIGMVFQEPMSSLNPVISVGTQIEETLRAHGWRDRNRRQERVIEVLKQVHFPYHQRCYRLYPHELSGGLRQR
ncbi:MAG: ATP-binding cassette domain-containing protein, partial [Chlamydiota bacterium]|nr:ATP-binding cassette domain-containing protein [Chlamydiota bacterium]